MKKFLIGTLVVVAIAVVAALVAPSFIDWNAYRGEIATAVRQATGRKLTIDGRIDVALLPAPQLSVAKVRLANLAGAQAPDMVRLDALDVRIAFWPLLEGKIVVDSIVLRGADIELETLADGRVNWKLAPEGKAGARTPATGAGKTGGGAGAAAAAAVRLNRVVIDNGRLTWRDARKGTVERIEKINARLTADTLSGPFTLRGNATVHGVPLAIDAQVGRIETGKATPVTANVTLMDAHAQTTISGTVTPGDVPRAKFKVDASGGNLGAVVAALSGGAPPAILAHKFTLDASVSGDSRNVAVNDIALSLNGTRATGAVNAILGTVPSVDATFGITTLDLDSWLAAAARGAPATSAGSRNGGKDSGKAAPPAAGGFALPDNIRAALDVHIDGVTFRKGVLQEVNLQGNLDRGVFTLTRATAQLPGSSDLSLAGRLSAVKGAPHFTGQIAVNAADVRALADWFKVDLGGVAPDRLHKASFRAGLGFSGDRLELSGMDLRFDSTHVSGGVVVALRARPGIGANIVVDRLNLDSYMGAKAKGTKGSGGAAGTGAGGAAKDPAIGGLAALGTFDANIRASAKSLTVRGVTLGGVSLDSSLIDGDLTVRSLRVADLSGGTLNLSGKVAHIDKAPEPDIRFALATKKPERLFALAGIESPVAPARLAPLSLDGAFKAGAKETRVDAKLAAGALRVAVNGTVAGLTTAPRLALDLKAEHPSFLRFVRLFDPHFTPRKTPTGPFSLSAHAEGAGLDLKLTNVKGQFGQARVTGTAAVALAAFHPKITADFKAGDIVAGNFVPEVGGGTKPARAGVPGTPAGGAKSGAPWTDQPMDLDLLRAFDADVKVTARSLVWRSWKVTSPRIDMTLENGRFDLKQLTGSTVGGTFDMTGSLAPPPKPGGPADLQAKLDITRADLNKAMFNLASVDLARGKVTMHMNIAGKGASTRALVSSLDGAGSLEAVDGAISGFDLARVNDRLKNLNTPTSFLTLLQAAMSGGETKFSKFSGTFKITRGVVRSTDIALKADGGDGSATLTADLPKWRIDADAVFRLSGHKDAPPFRMALKGPLDQPKRIFNFNDLQSWLVRRGVGGLMQKLLKKKNGQGTTSGGQGTSGTTEPNPQKFIQGIFDALKQKK